jgi:hypothetical protein
MAEQCMNSFISFPSEDRSRGYGSRLEFNHPGRDIYHCLMMVPWGVKYVAGNKIQPEQYWLINESFVVMTANINHMWRLLFCGMWCLCSLQPPSSEYKTDGCNYQTARRHVTEYINIRTLIFFLLFLVRWDWVRLLLRPLLAYCTSPRW